MNSFTKLLLICFSSIWLFSCFGKEAKPDTKLAKEEKFQVEVAASEGTVKNVTTTNASAMEEEIRKNKPPKVLSKWENQGKDFDKPLNKKSLHLPALPAHGKSGKKETSRVKEKEKKEFVMIGGGKNVNIRSGPGLGFAVIGRISEKENFELAGETRALYKGKPWFKILDENGNEAYVWSGVAQKIKGKNKEFGGKTNYFAKLSTPDLLTPPIPKELRKTREISLNFDSVSILEIIQTFSELLQLNYIIEQGISGDITLQTSQKIPVKDLFKVLEQILALNNVTIIKKGRFYHFLPISETKSAPLGIYQGMNKNNIPDEDRMIIQILPLKYIPSKSLEAMVKPFLSKHAQFINLETTNTLIAMELASNMRRLVEIINALDVNTIEKTDIELYPITYNDASEISKSLQDIFSNLGYQTKGPLSLKIVSLKRLNSILVVNSFPNLLPTIEYWIKKLDQPLVEGQVATYVYYLQNAEAGKLASLLKSIYRKKSNKKEREKQKRISQALESQKAAAPPKTPGAQPVPLKQPTVTSGQVLTSGELEGEITIFPDKDTNSLVIRTDPRNYPAIEETIKKLDLMPLQVLIEVMIMDVTLDEKTSFGLEWTMKEKMGKETFFYNNLNQGMGLIAPSATQPIATLAGGTGTFGMFVGITDRVMAMIQAYGLEDKANVLSSPVIITSENKPASINITNQIPITSATIVTGAGATPVTQETVQYKDVGIRLNVTAKINKERFVNLEISQEVSSVVETSNPANPRFFTRSANTNVVVRDNETIIVGGLMSTTKSKTKTGIPYLSKIPVLGMLFGAEKDSTSKSELLIFITPHVITSQEEGQKLTHEFREKLQLLKKEHKSIRLTAPGEEEE